MPFKRINGEKKNYKNSYNSFNNSPMTFRNAFTRKNCTAKQMHVKTMLAIGAQLRLFRHIYYYY